MERAGRNAGKGELTIDTGLRVLVYGLIVGRLIFRKPHSGSEDEGPTLIHHRSSDASRQCGLPVG